MAANCNVAGFYPISKESELLRRIERLKRKVNDLEIKNEKLERIVNNSFVGFKFNKEDIPNNSNHEAADDLRRMRFRQMLSRR